ncbi:SNF2 helicase associated domain-containing protein [Aneurinibacillus tyrosinisolvens]|uniref:SNF2 helicase associated domain-containing protein n=1 Tax=Aneurinibacillus tyrosinisolvens TaxID=1443435 RepID=UPI003F70468B
MYVVKNIGEFLQSIEEGTPYYFTSKFSFEPSEHYLLEEDRKALHLLREIQKNEEFFHSQQSYYWGTQNDRFLLISPMVIDRLFFELQGRNVVFRDYAPVLFRVNPEEHKLPLTFRLEKGAAGEFELDVADLRDVIFFESYGWLFQDGTFYKLSPSQKDIISKFFSSMGPYGESSLLVAQQQMETFISYVMPGLKEIGQVEVAEQISDQIVSPPLNVKMFIDDRDERMSARIEYHYGNIVIDPFREEVTHDSKQDIILMRDMEKEQEIMKLFESTPFKYNGKECYIEGDNEIYNFMFTAVPKLAQKAELYMSEAARSLTLLKDSKPITKIDVDSGGNLLEIRFDMEGIDEQEVRQILQSVVEKKKYYRLSNGAFVSLENETFQTMNQLFTELHINKSQLKAGVLQLPVYRSLQVDEIISEGAGIQPGWGRSFASLSRN